MLKTILPTIILCFVIVCGCNPGEPQGGLELPYASDMDKIRLLAIQRFDEENGSNSHEKYEISIRETPDRWVVYFNGKSQLPGDHMMIAQDRQTGKLEYYQGQ